MSKFRIILVGTFDASDVDDANKRLARMFLERINYERDLGTPSWDEPEAMFESTVEEPAIVYLLASSPSLWRVQEIKRLIDRYLWGASAAE